MADDIILYLLMYIDVYSLLIGTHIMPLAIESFLFIPIFHAETLSKTTYIASTSFLLILINFTVPI